ncbi:MAG: hypothetical protein H6700_08585 [Myxococcales bacterium]|nr:hypothetical protein [Myxococcales bacterium]
MTFVALAALHRGPDDLDSAVEVVESLREPGDLVLLYPAARSLDLSRLPPDLPAAATSSVPDELDRFERVIVVRDRDDEPVAFNRTLRSRAALLGATEAGALLVELYQIDAPVDVVDDLDGLLDSAQVDVVSGDDVVPCPRSGDRFECGDADWTWVGRTTQVFAGEPYACVWSHPIDGADLRITFPRVEGDHVSGWFGLTDYAVSIPDGSPVRFDVRAGTASGRFRAHRGVGRRPVDVALPRNYAGPLTITIAAQRAGVRHLCWSLQTTRSRGT